jgi:hypothetical protein
VLFMTSVLIAVLLVAPQSPAALGWELLAVAAVSVTVLLILDRRAGHGTDPGYIERLALIGPQRAVCFKSGRP